MVLIIGRSFSRIVDVRCSRMVDQVGAASDRRPALVERRLVTAWRAYRGRSGGGAAKPRCWRHELVSAYHLGCPSEGRAHRGVNPPRPVGRALLVPALHPIPIEMKHRHPGRFNGRSEVWPPPAGFSYSVAVKVSLSERHAAPSPRRSPSTVAK